jgi:hypothetical protein
VEEIVAKALVEVEASATDNKKDVSNILLDSVKEVAISQDNLLTVKSLFSKRMLLWSPSLTSATRFLPEWPDM